MRTVTRSLAGAENTLGGEVVTSAGLGQLHWASGLSAVEFAQVRADRLPATARAMLCVCHARYLALAGRLCEAHGQIAAADA